MRSPKYIPAILTSVAVNSMLNSGEPAYKVAIVGLAIWASLAAVYWGLLSRLRSGGGRSH